MVITDKSRLTAKPEHEPMKNLTALVLVIACVTGARLHAQIAAAPADSPFADESSEAGKGESEKQRQKEREQVIPAEPLFGPERCRG